MQFLVFGDLPLIIRFIILLRLCLKINTLEASLVSLCCDDIVDNIFF